MKRSTPLKEHEPAVEREPRPMAFSVKPLRAGTYAGSTSGVSVQKENPLRSEPYLRLVAARPCKNCGRVGRSQAAHLPPSGKSIKQDDRLTFPLCADEAGAQGCHTRFDQYKLFPRAEAMEQGMRWARETQAEISADGKWPKRLPRWVQ